MTDQYHKWLQRLKDTNPAHDMIPAIEGMSSMPALAIEYIKICLQDPVGQSREEYTIEQLHRQKSALYSRRAVLSNKFHLCQSDKERRMISQEIGSIQTEIIANRAKLDYYFSTGKLPKAPDKLILPASGDRKWKKAHSIRSSISRYRGLLRQERDQDKIKDYERKIIDLTDQLAELTA